MIGRSAIPCSRALSTSAYLKTRPWWFHVELQRSMQRRGHRVRLPSCWRSLVTETHESSIFLARYRGESQRHCAQLVAPSYAYLIGHANFQTRLSAEVEKRRRPCPPS